MCCSTQFTDHYCNKKKCLSYSYLLMVTSRSDRAPHVQVSNLQAFLQSSTPPFSLNANGRSVRSRAPDFAENTNMVVWIDFIDGTNDTKLKVVMPWIRCFGLILVFHNTASQLTSYTLVGIFLVSTLVRKIG